MRFYCLRSMQQMSEDKHGLESVSAWIDTALSGEDHKFKACKRRAIMR